MGVWDPELREWHDEDDSVEEANLKSLRFSLEVGSTSCLRMKLRKYRGRLEASESPAVRSEIADIVKQAETAFAIEAEHGIGSLINLDHPSTKKLIRLGDRLSKPLIPHSLIEAAERYRALRQDP